ncbi:MULTISPECIES: MarR family winged helix-turn-helix transcriptional regulator [Fischerella]|uniref:MarR family transcriptional regulator n=1 Tax=Fischerella muscicola CCMEE 5323 TaxID=2019572 RepID=A0A2N6K425_FISMU|nr:MULTISPECIES: MarR family transcriptional regulator [Fischerella]MBD2433387.1 MarR family transcriptional regulator [Fischerella sp. FACHB-380]PLZ90612.1 MarR family transcriptional regulator [Fischerella muscicola CCMEE 5323]
MSSKPMQETIGYQMVLVSRAHRHLVSTALAELGLYLGQEILLMYLWEEDGLTQSELVERMEVEPPTLTKMLNRMERCGLLKRCQCPEDARSYQVYLTEAGQALQQPVTQLWHEVEKQIVANLTLEERLLFRRLLMQVRNNLT